MSSRLFVLSLTLLMTVQQVYAQLKFSNIEDVWNYADQNSLTLRNDALQLSQAKDAKKVAVLGILDPTGSTSGSYTNNNRLPVSILPAEIVGGNPGEFQEVQFGLQYVTDFNFYLDIKLLNLQGWENNKLAKINLDLQKADNQLSLKNYRQELAFAFFNIITLQEQLSATESNLEAAKNLGEISRQKFDQGLLSQQDLNESKVNLLNVQDKLEQIGLQIERELLNLKTLCDLDENTTIEIVPERSYLKEQENIAVEWSPLESNIALLNQAYAKSYYRQTIMSQAPTISFFTSVTRQRFSTEPELFNNSFNWIPSSYVGFRIYLPLPTAVSVSQVSRARYDMRTRQNNAEAARIQSGLATEKLQNEYETAVKQYRNLLKIHQLRTESYEKTMVNFLEGIEGMDQIITAYNTMVNSNYSLIASGITIQLMASRIALHNKFK